MADAEALNALDATFLELEELEDGALMSIGGTMVFDPGPNGTCPDVATLRSVLVARLARLPRYSQRLSSTRTGGLSWPHWEADPEFDVRNHIRHAALPRPGSRRSCASGPPSSSPIRWTARDRCGKSC